MTEKQKEILDKARTGDKFELSEEQMSELLAETKFIGIGYGYCSSSSIAQWYHEEDHDDYKKKLKEKFHDKIQNKVG